MAEHQRESSLKISFLVTYYNQEQYVRQSLDSILAVEKTCPWEILVGDDGSSDGTCQIVESYIQQYPEQISLYVMPREEGKKYDPVRRASANRLNVLEHAAGDLFCVLDGDDFYSDPTFLKDALSVFEAEPETSVVGFGYQNYWDGQYGPAVVLRPGLTSREYLESWYIPAGGCVLRKNFDAERIEYLKQVGYFDDNNIVVNSLQFGGLHVMDRPFYAYRQTGSSVYSRMDFIQKAVLNVQGFDQDRMLSDPKYHDVLLHRYALPIVIMYFNRKKLGKALGTDQYNRILEESQRWNESLCCQIMTGQGLDADVIRNAAKSLFSTVPQKLWRTAKRKFKTK